MRWLVGLLVISGLAGCEKHAIPERYEFPAGLAGEFAVEFGVAGAPELPTTAAGRRVLRFDAHGYLATSSAQSFGILDTELVRVDAAGRAMPLRDVACAGETCKLAAGEAAILGTGSTESAGVKRSYAHGAVGPCEVGFSGPKLPDRR